MFAKSKILAIKKNIPNLDITTQEKIQFSINIEQDIKLINDEIASLSAENNCKMIQEHFSNITIDGTFSIPKMWSLTLFQPGGGGVN